MVMGYLEEETTMPLAAAAAAARHHVKVMAFNESLSSSITNSSLLPQFSLRWSILISKSMADLQALDSPLSMRARRHCNRSRFMSGFWHALFRQLGADILTSTACHPQLEERLDRTNQTAEITVRYFVSISTEDWTVVLPYLQGSLNNSKHHSIE